MGTDLPAAAAAAPSAEVGSGGGSGMEYADPAEASLLGDGVVVGPALPPTIRYGSVFSRAENALLIPAMWREAWGVTPWEEMGTELEGAPAGDRPHGEPNADTPYFIEDMLLDGPAYIDQPIDVEDDLYGDSQAGDITAERRDFEPEEDTAMDFEHPTYTRAVPQSATNVGRTYAAATGINEGFNEGMVFEAGADADLGGNREHDLHANNQAGNTMEGQQASWPNPNTAMDVGNPIYPEVAPQLPAITDRNRDREDNLYSSGQPGDITTGQHGFERMHNTALVAEHPMYPGAAPQLAIGRNNQHSGFGFVAGEDGPNSLGDNSAFAQAFNPNPAERDAIISGEYNPAVPDYHPNNLNESTALSNNFHIRNGEAARIEGQHAIWDEQPVYNYDFLDRNQGATPQGHPVRLNEQPAAWNYHSSILND